MSPANEIKMSYYIRGSNKTNIQKTIIKTEYEYYSQLTVSNDNISGYDMKEDLATWLV